MKFTGRFEGLVVDYATGRQKVSLSINEDARGAFDELQDCELDIEIKKYRKKRSLDANALLWYCIGKMANALREDKWNIYLNLLKSYGQYTYIVVKEKAVRKMKECWRECEEVGEITINGEKAIQLLCYYGSSTYDTKEFSILLDGTIQEMKNIGLQTPSSKEMRLALEKWENMKNGNK